MLMSLDLEQVEDEDAREELRTARELMSAVGL
jgi:hypothetical protein